MLPQRHANTALTKTITELQEPQHLVPLQRCANTAVTKLLQDYKNHNIWCFYKIMLYKTTTGLQEP